MVLILDGNWEIGAQIYSDIGDMFNRQQSQIRLFE